jgi:hypothetical protein
VLPAGAELLSGYGAEMATGRTYGADAQRSGSGDLLRWRQRENLCRLLRLGCAMMRSKLTRKERERKFAEALEGYESGRLTATQARIAAGLASRRAYLAYRFPHLFGHLCAMSAADRTRPVYAPRGAWRFAGDDRSARVSSGSRSRRRREAQGL